MDAQTKDYGQQMMSLPHDVVPLPSGGVFYKNKKKTLKVGYLTASDENILMGNAEDITTNLLRGKIYEPDVRIEDLLEGDVEALLVFLRNTSFGPEVEVTLQDPATKQNFKASVLIDTLPIVQNDQPDENGHFVVKLPKSGATVKLKPLTFGEITELQKLIAAYPQGRTAPRVTWRLQKQIVSYDGVEDKGEISQIIEKMPIMDSKFIRNYMKENEPRLNMVKEVTAPSGERLAVNVGFGVEFFRPFF